MTATSFCRLASTLVLTALLAGSAPASGATPQTGPGQNTVFQPLHRPATGQQHPGKFIWADLLTTDPVAAAKFYTGLFGWTANTIEQHGRSYTVFSNGSRPVAGLAQRHTANANRPSRWIGYVAVADIKSTLALVATAGGKVRAPARDFPDRGVQAIIADPEGASLGLLQSASGDSADDEPLAGDWNWFELYG